jgi:hypothetical protein
MWLAVTMGLSRCATHRTPAHAVIVSGPAVLHVGISPPTMAILLEYIAATCTGKPVRMFCWHLHWQILSGCFESVCCCYAAYLCRHNMTNVPRTIQEVESVMAGANWQVGADAAAEPPAKKICTS